MPFRVHYAFYDQLSPVFFLLQSYSWVLSRVQADIVSCYLTLFTIHRHYTRAFRQKHKGGFLERKLHTENAIDLNRSIQLDKKSIIHRLLLYWCHVHRVHFPSRSCSSFFFSFLLHKVKISLLCSNESSTTSLVVHAFCAPFMKI